MQRLVLVCALLAAIVVFFASGADRYLSLEGMRASLDTLQGWRERAPLAAGAVYFVAYVAVTALSLPGAAVMTLAGGALFGLGWGFLLVSFASSLGALLAFLVARYLLRDAVRSRFGERLGAIDEGIRREGAFYLFTLRLVPLFPFFMINLLLGLTPMRAAVFYGVSQLGMVPGTLVYVNAGTQLAALDSLRGILSPALIGSFALLGVFPLLARRAVEAWRRRRVYARWRRPARFERNLVVIGAGAAGLVTAYIGAAVKAKVTLVESHQMGGDCLNFGCVPSKALIRSAKLAQQMRHADRYGLEPVHPRIVFRKVFARVHEVVRAIEPHDSIERYTALGVDVRSGHARIIDPWTVEIRDANGKTERLTTRSIVIATGAAPFVPPLPGIDSVGCLTSDTLWEALAEQDSAPERVAVLGGGPIGVELAQALARLGSRVTLVEMMPRLLLREDDDVSAFVTATLANEGVEVLTAHKALGCGNDGDGKHLRVECNDAERRIGFDVLLCAVGRSARLSGFGLEELGIETTRVVPTNEYLETLYPNIYAAGDVAGPWQLTHAGAHQAWYAAVNALFGQLKRFAVDGRVMPWVTYCDPEVARVGLNERDAAEKGITVEVTRYELDDFDRAIADSAAHGFIKVLTPPGKDRILGVTIVGEHAGELLAEFVLAMRWGLGLNRIMGTIHSYPGWADANKFAAGAWKRAHAPQRLLGWVGKYHAWRRG